MTKFKKADLIDHIATRAGVSKKQAEEMLESVLEFVTSTMVQGNELTLTGFGTFLAKARKGRMGINPKNPTEKVEIPASIVPRFKAGKGLKDAVKAGKAS